LPFTLHFRLPGGASTLASEKIQRIFANHWGGGVKHLQVLKKYAPIINFQTKHSQETLLLILVVVRFAYIDFHPDLVRIYFVHS
jgi:hypothetical protein